MCQNQQMQQKEEHQQISCRPISSPSSTTLFKLSYLIQRLQKQKILQYPKHHHDHQHNQHHRQKHKARRHFPRCGLVFLIFLSVIKDSLTTTYATSLDATTMPPQTNFLPYFDFDVPRNMTVTVGQTGFLHCRVERLGDKDVSWIRKRDLHILTAGSTTYTSDQRFQVLRPENSGNWTLQIKYPQPRDSGIYECQINTEPKMSLSYTFNVVELKATIVGPTDLYVKSGSDINLTCRIIQGPHELGNIFWYKGSEIIDMAANQNEIDSGTRMAVENDWSDGLTSRLKIRRASSSDTGNYTCVPTIAKSSSVYVHVIIGEHPAAMQHNGSKPSCCNFYTSLCCMLLTILMCFLQHLFCTSTSNANIAKAATLRATLATKKPSTSAVALLMADTTDAATLQSASLSPSPSPSPLPSPPPSTSTSNTKPTIEIVPAVTTSKISQSKLYISSLASYETKAKQFPSPSLFHSITNTAEASLTATTCKRTGLLFSNGEISR